MDNEDRQSVIDEMTKIIERYVELDPLSRANLKSELWSFVNLNDSEIRQFQKLERENENLRSEVNEVYQDLRALESEISELEDKLDNLRAQYGG